MYKLQRLYNLKGLLPKVRLGYPLPPLSSLQANPPLHSIYSLSQRPKAAFSSDSDSDSSAFNNYGNNNKGYVQKRSNVISSAPMNRNNYNKNPIFVSKYFEITTEEITKFLDSLKIEYKLRPSGQLVTKHCPFCDKPHHNKIDNIYTLNIKPDSGAFLCFRCGTRGSWFDFKNILFGNGKAP